MSASAPHDVPPAAGASDPSNARHHRRLPSGPRALIPHLRQQGYAVGSEDAAASAQMTPAEGMASTTRAIHPSNSRTSPVRQDAQSRSTSPTRPQRGFGPPAHIPIPERTNTADAPSPPITSPRSRFSKLSLNTADLLSVRAPSPQKAASPSMTHWQQIRSHVLTSPAEEQAHRSTKDDKRLSGLVQKTVGRLGFRQAAENVMGLDQRRQSMAVFLDQSSGLSAEAKEEIIRERRRFARDVKACLDACTQEETRRRLQRASGAAASFGKPSSTNPHTKAAHHSDFSAFAPLLTELHKWSPAARARKIWCRTLPHHSAVLSELATAFLPDSTTTEGERQQVLEVFGAIVRTWAAEGPDEVGARWLWLCSALRVPERQLRERGITLLSALMRGDPAYGVVFDVPETATTYLALAMSLLQLLHAVDCSPYGTTAEYDQLMKLFTDLMEGNIMDVDSDSMANVSGKETEGSTDGVLKELIWLGAARCIGADADVSAWLLKVDNPLTMRLVPPPILHATPKSIMDMRRLATVTFYRSISRILPHLADGVAARAWEAVNDLVRPHADAFPGDAELRQVRTALLIDMIFRRSSSTASPPEPDGEDPFAPPSPLAGAGKAAHDELRTLISASGLEANQAIEAWRMAIRICGEAEVVAVLRMELKGTSKILSSHGVEVFLEGVSADQTSTTAQAFLSYLRTSHPELFYKPLFSLAACISAETLTPRLRLVRLLSQAVGSDAFWLDADAAMVSVIICAHAGAKAPSVTSDAAPLPASSVEGTAREDKAVMPIGIGKYAVILELLTALQALPGPVERNSRMRSFLDKIESKVSAALLEQERTHTVPTSHRLALLHFFLRMRQLTRSGRRSGWMACILGWRETKGDEQSSTIVSTLREAYTATNDKDSSYTEVVLQSDFDTALARLLVLIHPCWSSEEWEDIGSHAWRLLGNRTVELRHLCAYLFTKATDHLPSLAFSIAEPDLTSASDEIRLQAIDKLTMLYRCRYELARIASIADPNKPPFHFPASTSTTAPTEIGSSTWVPPVDLTDAALNQFGKTLPIDVRRQLLDLGWSDDPNLKNTDDERAQVPIGDVPLSYVMGDRERHRSGENRGKGEPGTASAKEVGERRLSTSSQGSDRRTAGRYKAVITPLIAEMLSKHSVVLSADVSADIRARHADLVQDIQREDASSLLHPFHNPHISVDVKLGQLNSIIGDNCTPSFAYAALNAIAGLLRYEIRHNGKFAHHAACLDVVARLIPHVPGITLREIRKNRAEQALLPGTIYEDGTSFHAFPAWVGDTADIEIQTAQLRVLSQLVTASPRDAYLLKRILLNLDVGRSLADLAFAQAWHTVMSQLFTTVQRTYNDRSELEHFLRIAGQCIALHPNELTVVSGCCRLIMLCSARFRRLFDTNGMAACGVQLFEAYTDGNNAIRDAVLFTCRSIYRIHSDTSIYQLCACLADSLDPHDVDASALYDLLASLSVPAASTSGMASGLRGVNDSEELAAHVQMLSGPELAFSDIGKDRAERQAAKVAAVVAGSVDKRVFPLANIVRLFMTAIAVNPPAPRSIALLTIFSGMVEKMVDEASRELLKSAVVALGRLIKNKQVDADAVGGTAQVEQAKVGGDWPGAIMAYLRFVTAFVRTIGHLDHANLRQVLDILVDVFTVSTADIAVGSDFIAGIAEREATAPVQRKDGSHLWQLISPAHVALIGRLDWSPVYRALTKFMVREVGSGVNPSIFVVQSYLDSAIRHAASDSRRYGTAHGGSDLIDLAITSIKYYSDPLRTLEVCEATPDLLLRFVLPFALSFKLDHRQQDAEDGVWLRLLQYTVSRAVPPTIASIGGVSDKAALLVLGIQVVKVIMVRGSRAVSATPGIWTYLCDRLVRLIDSVQARSSEARDKQTVTVLQWAMWSVYEFAALYRSPLLLDLRSHMLDAISAHHAQIEPRDDSFEKTPSLSYFHVNPPSPLSPADRPRFSLRVPSDGSRRASRYSFSSPDQSLDVKGSVGENDGVSSQISPRHSPRFNAPPVSERAQEQRMSLTPFASPIIGTARRTSNAYGALSSPGGMGRSPRDTSEALIPMSRNASPSPSPSPSPRPPNVGRLIAPGIRNRFPSSAPTRNVYMDATAADPMPASTGLGIFGQKAYAPGGRGPGQRKDKGKAAEHKKGGAIVHLLGAPTQMLAAPGMPGNANGAVSHAERGAGDAYKEYRIRSEPVLRRMEVARRRVEIVLGGDGGEDEEEVNTTQWRDADALSEISLQTQMLVHEELTFLNDDDGSNDTTDGNVIIDTSRLSAVYDRDLDEEGDVSGDGNEATEKYFEALQQQMPFLGRQP